MSLPSVCIVIPCYNEENRLNLGYIGEFLKKFESISIILANDGSTDNTENVITNFINLESSQSISERLHYLHFFKNQGKAETVRCGMLFAANKSLNRPNTEFYFSGNNPDTCDYIGFWDADMATPLEEIPWFFGFKRNEHQILLGSRLAILGSNINRTRFRFLTGRIFATIISFGLSWKVYDTQCGAKIFHRDYLEVFNKPFYTKWLFDVEILLRLKQQYGEEIVQKVVEIPVRNWSDIDGSKIKFTDFLKVPFQILGLFRHYRKFQTKVH